MILLPMLTRSLRYRLSGSLWLRRWIIPLCRVYEVMRCYQDISGYNIKGVNTSSAAGLYWCRQLKGACCGNENMIVILGRSSLSCPGIHTGWHHNDEEFWRNQSRFHWHLLPSYGSCSKSQNQSRIILTFIVDVIGIRYQKFQEMALILEFELLFFLYEALTRLVLDLWHCERNELLAEYSGYQSTSNRILSFLQSDPVSLEACCKSHPLLSQLAERFADVVLDYLNLYKFPLESSEFTKVIYRHPHIATYVHSIDMKDVKYSPELSSILSMLLKKVMFHSNRQWQELPEHFYRALLDCIHLSSVGGCTHRTSLWLSFICVE